ncbi:polyprenol phosphomannose-dependent alpha 1,6 mannosyltransferase MptB [Kitasatospora paracochleata]|uniref:Alpha-1,6-mannosyltransferase n=1 Tax=Kitasatospora paracochleata TaxID=58354 RepID=A0ABT1J4K0_9ACTN|nr:polyprenol phosphomannose-dependent alpha 1,6 mannosyltransferase MptB [Kitasatospora paracochleata]MCP2312074.1 hypothetical protein [Kitasatospora paracochleata]
MPHWALTAEPRRCRWLGLAGSLALAAGSLRSGALPVAADARPVPGHAGPALLLTGLGTVLLVAAWLLLGRALARTGRAAPVGVRWLAVTLAWWAGPLLAAAPLFSRDVYSYLAQGAMLDAGLDVYAHGPADLGGPEAAQVPDVWLRTPAPYGPLFLALARTARAVAGPGVVGSGVVGSDVVGGVLALRALALAGTVALVVLLPRLARACGVPPAAALWLGALNPLVLLHLIGGAHNDAVLLPLLVGGLLAARRGQVVGAAALVTLAALVKAPAVLALPAVAWLAVPQEAAEGGGPRRTAVDLVRAAGTVAVAAVATTVLVTALAGTGYGWVAALGTPVSAGSWSPVSSLGRAAAAVFAAGDPAVTALVQRLGLGGAATVAVLLARRVARGRIGAVHATGLALAALVLLGPALRPWYALWAVVLIAAAAPLGDRTRSWTAAACAVLAFAVVPDGFTPGPAALALTVAGGAAGAGVAALVAVRGVRANGTSRAGSSAGPSRPRTAEGAAVRMAGRAR